MPLGNKEKFLKVYANLPLGVRQEIVVVHESQPMAWDAVYIEVVNDTPLSVVLLEKLAKMNLI